MGGSDSHGVRKTSLAEPYTGGKTLAVKSADGFRLGDFIYLEETQSPYSKSTRGRPYWPVDDVFYKGWANIVQNVDQDSGTLPVVRYHFSIPKLPEGAVVIRSGHANAEAFEFMDAEYNQWPMHGETKANAGPFNMQHGCWRVEVEPIEKRKFDVFLHVMLPCDVDSLSESQAALREKVKLTMIGGLIRLEIEGKSRSYKIDFRTDSPDAIVTVTEAGKTVFPG